MNLDDNICYCHQVSLRKLISFARRTRPTHVSQMADCLGAGTGCGWCIPFLQKILAAVQEGREIQLLMEPADYAAQRAAYRAGQAAARETKPDDAPQSP